MIKRGDRELTASGIICCVVLFFHRKLQLILLRERQHVQT